MANHKDEEFKPGIEAAADIRIAAAIEYIAKQLGQINRKLDALIAAVERGASGQPPSQLYSSRKRQKDQG
jgi:hypothetical protein